MDKEIKNWEVWSEGYAATGEHGTALLEGVYKGETFDDAVEDYLKVKEATSWPDIRTYYSKMDSNGSVVHSIWGCRLFKTETEARQSFG